MREMEVSKSAAEWNLREHSGDVVAALCALTNWVNIKRMLQTMEERCQVSKTDMHCPIKTARHQTNLIQIIQTHLMYQLSLHVKVEDVLRIYLLGMHQNQV